MLGPTSGHGVSQSVLDRPHGATGRRDDYIDLMAGIPQIAADLPQRTSRQLWAKTGLPRCKKHRKTFACDKRSRRDEPGDEVCRVRPQFTGAPSGARSMISIRVPQGSVM